MHTHVLYCIVYAPTVTHTHTTHNTPITNKTVSRSGATDGWNGDGSISTGGWTDGCSSRFLPLCVSSRLSVCLSLSSLAKSEPHGEHTNTGKAGQKQPGSQPARYPLGRAKAKTPTLTQPNTYTGMKQTSLAPTSAPPHAHGRKRRTYVTTSSSRAATVSIGRGKACQLHKCQGVCHIDIHAYIQTHVRTDRQKLSSER